MSTKINVRSPYYLHLTEPTVPLPLYDCTVANLTGFSVDNQGVITLPSPDYGTIHSYTSSAGDFANGKFGTVSTDTSRTVVFTLTIPAGFSNTSDLFFECGATATQAGTTTSTVETPCTPSVTTSGSIPSQTIDSGGATVDIDLSGYFTGETTYAVSNNDPLLVTTALNGSTLTISSNAIAGSTTVYALGRDGSYPTTCEAVQPISVTVSATGVDFDCSPSPLSGGSIAADGTITRPVSTAVIQGISLTNGGALLSPEQVSANTGESSQDVTLWFKLTAPAGYDNAGATVWCSSTLTQAGTAPLVFSCSLASLTGQKIARDGSISLGTAALGTVVSFTPPDPPFGEVTTDTSRTVEFQVEIPSGYANAGSAINCSKTLTQPATVSICGSNEFYLSTGKNRVTDFCDATYSTPTLITSTASTITGLMGSQICKNGSAFNGRGLYYGVRTAYIQSAIGIGVGDYYVVQIDSAGIVLSVEIGNCQGGGGSGSSIIL